MTKSQKEYTDYKGYSLPDHDGRMIYVKELDEVQYFGIDGIGFLHDGSPLALPGLPKDKKQFFLHDGTAIIHDGSPIKLPDGKTQFFNEEGCAMWPVDLEKTKALNNQQRKVFFEEMLNRVGKTTPLNETEKEDLRLALLAAEHPDNDSTQNFFWSEDIHATGLEPIADETASLLMTLEIIWPLVWRDYQSRHKEVLAARYVLCREKKENCPYAKLPASESMLINELRLEFKKAEKAVDPPNDFETILELDANEKGIFELDARLLAYVKKMRKGEGTSNFLAAFNSAYKSKQVSMAQRRDCWLEPLFLHRCIAEILWFNGVREKAEGAYKKPPALPIIVSDTISDIVKKGTHLDAKTDRILNKDGKELAVIDRENLSHIPAIPMATLQKILSPQNSKILHSVNYFRLVTWEVTTSTQQILNGDSDARAIKVPGGYPEIAKLCGAGISGKARDNIKKLLAWQASPQTYILHDRHGNHKIVAEGNMISFERIHGGQRNSLVTIVLGTMLLPHNVFKMIHSHAKSLSSEATMLFPLPNYEPNLIGKNNTFASQLSFQWDFLAEMRKRAKELARKGCVYMPPEKIAELAHRSNLKTPFHLRVLDAWLNDGDNPAFLSLIEKDHYALAPEAKRLQDFMVEGGKKEIQASKAGKTAAKRKANGVFSKKKS